jgi:hypothetical protein
VSVVRFRPWAPKIRQTVSVRGASFRLHSLVSRPLWYLDSLLKYDHLFFSGFAIQAKARELVGDRSTLRIPCTYVAVMPDVVMSDLLKMTRSSSWDSTASFPPARTGVATSN